MSATVRSPPGGPDTGSLYTTLRQTPQTRRSSGSGELGRPDTVLNILVLVCAGQVLALPPEGAENDAGGDEEFPPHRHRHHHHPPPPQGGPEVLRE